VFLFIIAENSKHGNVKLEFYYVHARVHADIIEYFNPATDTLEILIVPHLKKLSPRLDV